MKRKVVITGLSGFIGSHLRDRLAREADFTVPDFQDSLFEQSDRLLDVLAGAHSVVHLAAMNRGDDDELYRTNVRLVETLVAGLRQLRERPHVIFASSTQHTLDNPYGRSKKAGEQLLEDWASASGAPATVAVIPNVFGDRGRPFYNSVVATFCHQVTHGEKPTIQSDKDLNLIYVGDLCEHLLSFVRNPPTAFRRVDVPHTDTVKVSAILSKLEHFRECRYERNVVPELADAFSRNLFNVFLSFAEAADYRQPLVLRTDPRGSLFEIVKEEGGSQMFFSTSKPGVVRGNHYHTRKMEKFCVVKGRATIRLRRIGTNEVHEYHVSGEEPVVVEMPIFYTHNIENTGPDELCTLFWSSEVFDPSDPDTYAEKV